MNTESFLPIISPLIVPIVSLMVTGFVTVSVSRASIKNTRKNIFIQAFQLKISNSIDELITYVKRGEIDEINKFLSSGESLYIPFSLKLKIAKQIRKEINPTFFDKISGLKDKLVYFRREKPTLKQKLLDLVHESLYD